MQQDNQPSVFVHYDLSDRTILVYYSDKDGEKLKSNDSNGNYDEKSNHPRLYNPGIVDWDSRASSLLLTNISLLATGFLDGWIYPLILQLMLLYVLPSRCRNLCRPRFRCKDGK